MAYDSVRAQLDKLLGADRNGPLTGVSKSKLHYSDPSICKHFLLGFCPNDLHIKHRSEQGSCPKEHLTEAKANFERDRELGQVKGDLVRWTRDSLQVCRGILADEERKIRAHARRLQDTYNSHDSLSGLMIKNFDTLKKLGMVSQDAKVVVLSELDNDDKLLGPDLNPSDDVGADKLNNPNNGGAEGVKSTDANSKALSQGSHSLSSSDDGAGKHGDIDDDLEGFGEIKVVSATKGTSEAVLSETRQDRKEMATETGKDQGKSTEKGEGITISNNSPSSDAENATAENKARLTPTSVAAKAQSLPSDSPTTKENLSKAVGGPGKEQDEPEPSPQDKMEEFYASGKGPDGLLMLERKQSLRVCACCGGFISLVDAESRLLSHYGGKSHQSLLQLRRRVEELERICADMRKQTSDRPPYDGSRKFPDSRDSRWMQRDHRRAKSPNDQRDAYYPPHHSRYADRYDYRRDNVGVADHRGYANSDWRRRPSRDHDDFGRNARYRHRGEDDRIYHRLESRRGDEDHGYHRSEIGNYHRRDEGYNSYPRGESMEYHRRGSRDFRYESGRKRRRSGSPDCSRQRSRHY